MIEKRYAPLWETLNFRWYPTGESLRESDVVGISVERDKHGYATAIFQSDGKKWDIGSQQDAWTFLSSPDSRLFFVDGVNRELEPILKWLGRDACEQLCDGFEVNGLKYLGGVVSMRRCKKIWSLKPFYTSDLLPPEDDCYGVQARGERLVKCIKEAGLPLMLHSCGSMLSGMARLPYMSAPERVSKLAYECYHGGWIEAMKLGHFDDVYDYDLSSAYPSEADSLLSCNGDCGYWVDSVDFVSDAYYGFCRCKIRLDLLIPFSPIMMRVRSVMSKSGRWPIRSVRNPVGVWEGWLTKEEIEFIVKNWLGDVEILEGVWFIPTRYHHPYHDLVSRLREVRRRGEKRGDVLMKNLGKLTAAAIQGKMMQSFMARGKRMVGNAMNPVYAASLTARVRLRVAEVAMEDWEHILMVIVDGILSSRPLPVPKQWKLAHVGECVIANHGDYSIPDRRTAGRLAIALAENPMSNVYALHAPRYESISESLEAGTFDFACMRRPEVWSRVSKVGKRYWESLPRHCEDLLNNQYNSSPLIASERTMLGV